LLAHFLTTSDDITSEESSTRTFTVSSAIPARTHPPPLYYLPAILTPVQESFLERRKAEVADAAEKEWHAFKEDRERGVAEIEQFRQRVAEAEVRRKAEKSQEEEQMETDAAAPLSPSKDDVPNDASKKGPEMDVDEPGGPEQKESAEAENPASMQADGDDAVEY